MKTLYLTLLIATPLVLSAQSPAPSPRLAGIISVGGSPLAIVEEHLAPQSSRELVLAAGQRDGNLTLLEVHPDKGRVKIRVKGDNEPRILALSNATNTASGIALEGVGVDSLLKLMGRFSQRTVLQHPRLPEVKFTLTGSATNQAEAAQILTNALTEQQISLVPDGDKFWLVGPSPLAAALNPRSAQLPKSAPGSVDQESLPAGSINFSPASLSNVLIIYAEFLGGKPDWSNPLLSQANGKVSLTMPTALTRQECGYALETLVGWHGIKLLPAEDGLVKAMTGRP